MCCGSGPKIQNGLALAGKKFGKKIVSVGADTWGVDFVLLNRQDEILGQPYHYRDARTNGMMAEAFKKVPRAEIFAQSGLQFMQLNSLYQLLAWQAHSPDILDAADTLLFMPDFLHWAMCGAKKVEFTNASTSQFVHPLQRNWSLPLLKQARFAHAFPAEDCSAGHDARHASQIPRRSHRSRGREGRRARRRTTPRPPSPACRPRTPARPTGRTSVRARGRSWAWKCSKPRCRRARWN